MSQQKEVPELLEVVAGNLVSVEEGLAALDTHRNTLHMHADEARSEISSAVERQLEQLRAREKHLIRQVELATTHQNCEVNVIQAQLLQHKGALSVTRTILDNCNSPSLSASKVRPEMDSSASVKTSIATTINSLPHQEVGSLLQHTEKLVRLPLVSVTVNESELNSAVQSFGKVGLPVTISHSSDFLPYSLEEYGDADHHVLHKSVQPEITSPSPINVRKPYLLAAKNFPPRKRAVLPAVKAPESNKEELVKWLRRLQMEAVDDSACAMEEECCGGDVCVEDACQANELCQSFSNCLMKGQCQKSAEEKVNQTNQWHLKQLSSNSSASRKRHNSENNEPAKHVLSHMSEILSSDNGNWLIGNKKVSESNKRMKTCHMEVSTPIKKPSDVRPAILYQAPQSTWVLTPEIPKAISCYKPLVNNTSEEVMEELEVNKNIKSWLLSSKESHIFANNKKANCEKENTLYRAGLIKTKSQLSLNSFGSLENVKDKIEKLSLHDSDFKKPGDKEQWLLQQCASIKSDNKILEEVMSKKYEWLSNSSFSIISEPEVASFQCNNWLLSN